MFNWRKWAEALLISNCGATHSDESYADRIGRQFQSYNSLFNAPDGYDAAVDALADMAIQNENLKAGIVYELVSIVAASHVTGNTEEITDFLDSHGTAVERWLAENKHLSSNRRGK